MAAVNVFTSGVTTSNGSGAYVKTRIPAIVKTGSTLVAFCEGRRIDNDFGDIEIIASQSTDGGATWTGTDCIRVKDNGTATAGNPVPMVNSSGHIVLLYVEQDTSDGDSRFVYKTVSTDAGSTWSASVLVDAGKEANWTWVATGPCHGIRISTGPNEGRLVCPLNGNIGSTYMSGSLYSDDEGDTWTRSTMFTTSAGVWNVNECSVAELNDGRLALFARNQFGSGGEKSVQYSSDDGETWTDPIDANIESADAVQGSALKHTGTPNKALFYSTPEIQNGGNREDLRILRSLNNGTTWDLEEFIHDNAGYSDLVETGPNSIGILYERGVSPQYQAIDFLDIPLSVIHQVGATTMANTTSDQTSITVNKPTGVEEGHLLLAAITTNDANCTPPAGWTEFNDAGTTIRTQMFWKLADGSEGADFTFSFSGGRPICGTITAWSGVHQTTPISGVATATVNAGAAEPQTTPSVTNNTAQRGLVHYIRSSYNSNSTSPVTNSTAVTTVTEIAENSAASASTNRGHTWYVDNGEFTNNSATKTGIALTAGDTEEGNVLLTFVIQTDDTVSESDFGVVTETEFIDSTITDSDSGTGTDTQLIGGDDEAVYYIAEGGMDFSNCRIQMVLTAIEENPSNLAGAALRFRRSDEQNFWEFGTGPTSDEYILRKVVNNVIFIVTEPKLTRGAGDVIRVDAFEERINCYVNNTLIISITDTDLIDNETVGLRFSTDSIDTAIDNFYALQLEDDIRDDLSGFPNYEFFVDWDNDGGLTLGDFETTLDTWSPFGTEEPDISVSNLYVRSGFQSMHIEWNNWIPAPFVNPPVPFKFNQAGQGFDDGFFALTKNDVDPGVTDPVYVAPGVDRTITKLVPGREYNLRTWVYVPSFSTPVTFGIRGISGAVTSTENNKWEELNFTYIATATEHEAVFASVEVNPDGDNECFVDEVMNIGAYEDITCYVIGSHGNINFRYGRDQARSLASIAPGEVELDLDNESQIFSPDNPGSVLAGFLAPGKPMLIRSTYNETSVNLFHGFVDNYTLHPDVEDRYVTMTCMDVLQYLANAKISTQLYPSIQTGEAINVILDQVNWPQEKREIDQGATTVRWWWEDETDGLEAVQKLVESEGLPAIAFVDAFGNFVFRSRHHRLLRTESKSVQAYIRCDNQFDEPNFSGPITYDIGWKDIINQVKVDIDERGGETIGEIWSQNDLISIEANQVYTLNVKASDPFYNAVLPTVANGDIKLKTASGPISTINMSKTSGQSTTLTITAGATPVLIGEIKIRGNSVPVLRTKKVIHEDSTSVTTYGPQTQSEGFPWANLNDMDMISQIILGQRADRLPVVHINLNNGHPIRISHMLNRKLSDRIHIEEMLQTFMNDDYFIEVLDHEIRYMDNNHVLTLGCEKAREQLAVNDEDSDPTVPTFTFDVTGKGFDDGYFSPEGSGFTLSNNLFILDSSRLDEDGLGF